MASISALGIGSGLDLNGLLDQLNEAERGKLQPIQQQIQQQEVQISAYGEIQSALAAVSDRASALNDPSLYQSVTTEVNGGAVEAAAGEGATPGRYEVTVNEVATAGNLATSRVDSLESVITEEGGKLALTFDDASLNHEVQIEAGSTLEGVRDAINADPAAAVNASIIFDGEGHRLALMSEETGREASITGSSFDQLADGALADAPGGTVAQLGGDADLEVNGIQITSTTNRVEDAIQGVTLELQQQGTSTVEVAQDSQAVRDEITGFVEAYNELKGTASRLTAFNGEEGQAGTLIGDGAVRGMEASLRRDLAAGVSQEGVVATLVDVGLSLAVDGTLNIDEAALDAAIVEDVQALAGFFAGDTDAAGLAGRLDATLAQMLGDNAALQGAINSAESRIDSLGERYTRTEQTIERTIDRYRTQFSALDGMIAQMNQTSAYLSEQLSNLGGPQQGGGGMM
ncbi:flagellar filament capping protein FliD [Halomonas alkalicola]|uniref:flagellar filament capping protein FliD n=1 Tax=Halomonas alkalicola TaxID=1930622 RepID=UPI00265EBF77|nr:flagellar filament capping protein FliD [Halomonas alkalicola]